MERQKNANLDQFPKPSESFERAQWQWQWQSGPDADLWEETDPVKRTWKDYSDGDCFIIEKAFFLNKEVVDLKSNYEIDLKNMLEVDRSDRNKIRKVRRQEKPSNVMEIPQPVVKERKVMNEAFGTIQHFLEFLMKRTPEAYRLYQRLTKLPLDCKDTQFQDIIQEVVACIEKAGETRQKITKTRSESQKQDFASEAKKIVEVLKEKSATLEHFLKAVLEAYTMDTFICYWLNELLQSEDWEGINVLAPYLMCLVYIFKLQAFIINDKGPQGLVSNLIRKQKLMLYRPSVLLKTPLEIYNPEKVKYFSWNGISSTTREKSIAMDFLLRSIKVAKIYGEVKFGAFFKIESDFASQEDREGIIAPWGTLDSEVLLAPGTVFKLLNTHLIQEGIYEVNLKIIKKFGDTNENIPLLGTLLDQSLSNGKAIIDGFPSQKSFQLLNLLRGNKLIRVIEIKNSKIDEHLMEEIENMRRTSKVQKQDIRIIDSTLTLRSYSSLVHYFLSESLGDIITRNKIIFQKRDEGLNKSLKVQLTLKEDVLNKVKKAYPLKELWKNIKQDSQIASLDVSMIQIPMENSEFKDFLESIKKMKHLESLSLILSSNLIRSTEDFSYFCRTIESLRTLKRLSIGLDLSDAQLKLFKKVLSTLTSLEYLSLNLKKCNKISDEGLYHLITALQSLKYLQSLSLDLADCNRISDDGLNHIKTSLRSITSLKYLILNFSWCNELSNEGLHHISTALPSLPYLEYLSLDFTRCDRISEEGLKQLHLGLGSLKYLHYLSLNFARCFKISDEGLNHLGTTFPLLKSLRNLSLDFTTCDNISNEGIEHLTLSSLRSLQHLSLNFNNCYQITKRGLSYLQTGLASLSSLQHLSLSFNECSNLSSEGLDQLKTAFMSLASLQYLSLDFTRCDKVSDKGLNSLSIGLTSLKKLQHLSLNFGWCKELSKEGLNHLKAAKSLQYLSLDFTRCDEIADEGFKSVADSLFPLLFLQHLVLNLSYCRQVTDEGLKHLTTVLKLLIELRHLSLDFSGCEKVTNEAVENLKDELKSIQHLECRQSAFE